MLKQVHKNAWETFQEKQVEVETITGHALGEKPMQTPGEISEAIFDAVQDEVSNLGAKTKYTKR